MDENPLEIRETATIAFEGDNEIGVHLLLNVLGRMVDTIEESVILQYNDSTINLKVKAFEKGSFEINLESLFVPALTILPYINDFIGPIKTFLEIIKIKKELKGQKPTLIENLENGQAKIVNAQGEISYHNCNVTNLYINSPGIDNRLSSVFEMLSMANRQALSMQGGESSVRIEKEEYPMMSTTIIPSKSEELIDENESISIEELYIKKPDLLGNSQWEFQLNGKRIVAEIEDNDFREQILSGKISISAGTKMRAKLKTSITKDRNQREKKEYTIVQVLGDLIPPPEQLKLDF